MKNPKEASRGMHAKMPTLELYTRKPGAFPRCHVCPVQVEVDSSPREIDWEALERK